MIRLILLIISIVISLPVWSQYHQLNFRRIGIPQGLSQNSANAIIQDKSGYIWVATQDGLNKFNGYEFTVFKHKQSDSTSIRDNFILSLLIDNNGDLWVGTSFGLDRLKSGSNQFEHYSLQNKKKNKKVNETINSLAQDKNGNIWIATLEGLYILNPKTNEMKSFETIISRNDSLPSKIIYKLFSDHKQNIWIGSSKGLSHYDFNKKSLLNYFSDSEIQNSLPSNVVISMAEDTLNILWIGTTNGLASFDQNSGVFTRFQNDPKNEISLSNNYISSLFVDKYNNLWVGTTGGGLNKLDRPTGFFYHNLNSIDNLNSVGHNDILSIFEDRTQVLWVGSDGGGLSLYDGKPPKFNHIYGQTNVTNSISSNDIWSIYDDEEGIVYVGTNNGGLNIISTNGTISAYEKNEANPFSISSNSVYSILKDKKGNLWIGTGYDLDKFDSKTKKFSHHLSKTLKSRVSIRFLSEGSDGVIWCGNSSGLISYNTETSEIIEFKSIENDSSTITAGQVTAFFKDSKNRTWVGTSSGLNLFDPISKKFRRFIHDSQNPNSICYPSIQSIKEDKNGNIWLGTGLGLCVFNPSQNQFKSYFEDDGLPNACIYNILEDKSGYFWLSTNNGLSKFDPLKVYSAGKGQTTSLFRNFSKEDGLQSNEFNHGAAFRSETGELFFGGINGFNRFFPDKIVDNNYIPQIVITEFKILDSPANFRKIGDRIVLNSLENVFSFEFASLDYTNPSDNQYAYKLENFDNDWIYSGTRRFISYTNLDAGDYVFRVIGSNNDGIWNKEGASIKLTIIPPFWKTKAAYFFYLFSVIAFIYGIIRWRAFRLESEKRTLEKLVTEKTSELKSSYEQLRKSQDQLIHTEKMRVIGQLASGIAHDINNILSIILGSSEILLNNSNDIVTIKRINTISKAASDGATIIRRLQEFSKNEYAHITETVNLNEILVEVIEMTTYLVVEKKKKENINVSFKHDFGEIPPISGNASELRSVITNIIINAIDSFAKSGNIYIKTVRKNSEMVELTFRDEGKGIEKEILDRIFEPFFTTKGTRGSGLGLSQVYGIISRHNGNINVESEYGKGTLITVQIPVSQMAEIVGSSNSIDLQTAPQLINETPNINQKVILIIEDEAEIRGIYNNILLDMGHEPVFAASGEEGIEKWKTGKYDMIISDIGLPGISGWDFIKSVRAENDDIPILVITGWGNEITSDRVSSNHINKIITKPFKFDQFINYVNELLNL